MFQCIRFFYSDVLKCYYLSFLKIIYFTDNSKMFLHFVMTGNEEFIADMYGVLDLFYFTLGK